MLLQAEGFAHQATNTIALDGVADAAGRNREPEPRMTERIRSHDSLEQCLTVTLPAFVDMIELRLVAEALAGAESERPDRISATGALGNETLAALGAATSEHLATTLRGHARAKTVCARTAHFAWVICTFHVKSRSAGNRSEARKGRQGYGAPPALSRKGLVDQRSSRTCRAIRARRWSKSCKVCARSRFQVAAPPMPL